MKSLSILLKWNCSQFMQINSHLCFKLRFPHYLSGTFRKFIHVISWLLFYFLYFVSWTDNSIPAWEQLQRAKNQSSTSFGFLTGWLCLLWGLYRSLKYQSRQEVWMYKNIVMTSSWNLSDLVLLLRFSLINFDKSTQLEPR